MVVNNHSVQTKRTILDLTAAAADPIATLMHFLYRAALCPRDVSEFGCFTSWSKLPGMQTAKIVILKIIHNTFETWNQ